MTSKNCESNGVVRIAHEHYVHVLNLNTNVTRLVVGPLTYLCLQDEKIVVGPEKMISIRPMNYCVVLHPVARDDAGNPVLDSHGQVKVRVGDEEYRFFQEPFPLYPGEKLKETIQEIPIISANKALHLECLMDFVDAQGNERIAGDEWLFEGPGTYYPRKEVKIVCVVSACHIEPNIALCIKALRDCVDRSGVARKSNEEWLVRGPGVYLVGPYERITEPRVAHKLTAKIALHVRALQAHTDEFGIKRRNGDEWLITSQMADSHICSVYEQLVKIVDITVLTAREFCVIRNPIGPDGVPQLGKQLLVRGEKSFFLHPGESLLSTIEPNYLLQSDEGLVLRATEVVEDEVIVEEKGVASKRKVTRFAGDQWMIRGPMEYVPPIGVTVVERRHLIPLDRNEGIYVKNTTTGTVRAVIGQAYMLKEDEKLWSKSIPDDVLQLLSAKHDPLGDRGVYASTKPSNTGKTLDLTRVVTFHVPHNAAVQVYDYKEKKARVEFGPTLIMLGPHEQFTKLSLSGGRPKQPNKIKSLCLLLGPDFCADIIVVETADHARLSLQLSYNWHFEVPSPCSQADAAKLFSVPDFIGDACKAIASRIRGSVASVKFDDFHRNSARIIRSSVFGSGSADSANDRFVFPQNNLHITSIDVQSVEPVDQRTRDSLQKSVQLAIEITTNSQEAAARHEADRLEQEARGRLERQRIQDEASAEEARRELLQMRVELAALESAGQAKAEAQSRAEAARIEGESAVLKAKLRAEAMAIETEAELERLRKARAAELDYSKRKGEQEIHLLTEKARIDISRFTSMVNSVGAETLKAIASAGSEHNLRMLSALGLQSTLITDGNTPVNLLTTAHGLIGQMMGPHRGPKHKDSKRSGHVTHSTDALEEKPVKFGDSGDEDKYSVASYDT